MEKIDEEALAEAIKYANEVCGWRPDSLDHGLALEAIKTDEGKESPNPRVWCVAVRSKYQELNRDRAGERNQVIEECLDALRALPEGTWGDESGQRCPWPVAIEAIEALKEEKGASAAGCAFHENCETAQAIRAKEGYISTVHCYAPGCACYMPCGNAVTNFHEAVKAPKSDKVYRPPQGITHVSYGERDRAARKAGKAVLCGCGKKYYPGTQEDRKRPRDEKGKLIPISRSERAGYCSRPCEIKDRKGVSK